jgi:ubiquinone/menaquinone biosynthesis C-methylase UbiE
MEAVSGRIGRYILDGADDDLRRLLRISQATADMARVGLHQTGIQPGWNAIDCGCGPIGALAVLAELVGPAGRVVGVDFSEPAVRQAQTVTSTLGLDNVELVAGDLHELDPTSLGAPFDVAYTRLFLMHQTDPVRTLRQIAALLRPGGWLVAHEPLQTPPRSHPHLTALDDYWALVHRLLEWSGVPAGAVEDLPRSARGAGFEVVGVSGQFTTHDPAVGFELHAGTIAAARGRAIQSGLTTEQQVDELVASLRGAGNGRYEWVTSPFFLELRLRKPATV